MHRLKTATIAALLTATATGAFSAGSGSATPPTATETTTECRNGQIYDQRERKCVDPRSGSLTDEHRYEAARELAYAGQYENALIVLAAAENQNDPRILNYKGFANRKAGRMAVGMAYYEAALDRAPDYVLARSYMGQAFLGQGDVEAAKAQLAEIETRAGRESWAYTALAQAIEGNQTDW